MVTSIIYNNKKMKKKPQSSKKENNLSLKIWDRQFYIFIKITIIFTHIYKSEFKTKNTRL